jgi:hypothetical protein
MPLTWTSNILYVSWYLKKINVNGLRWEVGIRVLYIGEIVDNQCLSFLLIILIFDFRSLAQYFFDEIFSYTCVHRDYKNRYMMSTKESVTSLLD